MTVATYEQCINELKRLGIKYSMVDHPAAKTTEEADHYIEGYEGARTKTMFLHDKHHQHYMIIMDDAKRMDFKKFQEISGTKRISMAKDEEIMDELGLKPGIISPFGLINNEAKDIKIYVDQMVLDEPIWTFHPNENTHTIFLDNQDVLKFIEAQGFTYEVINL
ncbi:prolyl-tRNA synthetase associated domain-containing protein [Lactobacillus alvi]|uniref:Prolyl-tRNA synthetase associated domain-containing protein n=1 Tax=Limosilactobacillus alvi TaxID=990412 RepID=A0ABS2EQD0_9LACO|nr:prolyl-tRNA synthetase associated domain-containing protein [Limosilactobacillus alvi]MBM6754603.1 prolyl-tRNA synthetase associated domain-containing protein [Limosilactobacillus alvi]